MRIVFHIGAHCTTEHRLAASLARDADLLAAGGVAVLDRADCGPPIGAALRGLQGAVATPSAENDLLRRLVGAAQPRRLVLSSESLVSLPERALDRGELYPRMFKAAWLRNVFPGHEVDFALAVRDPATFVPALYHLAGGGRDFAAFLGDTDPLLLRWSDPVRRLLATCPEAELTLWCYEDMPFVWDDVLRAVADLPGDAAPAGGLDFAAALMTRDGAQALRDRLAGSPPADRTARHQAIREHLARDAINECIEEEAGLPGWTAALMERLTAAYEAELAEIARLPRVRVIAR